MNDQRNIASFLPVLSGSYNNGNTENEDKGFWWSSEVYKSDGVRRYSLAYSGSALSTGYSVRYRGYSIRCINKQKTVLDLTYMQEMTPEIKSDDHLRPRLPRHRYGRTE